MLSWGRRRKERQQQVIREADNLMALFGDGAYSEALARARREDENGADPSHRLAVRRETTRCCRSGETSISN
jgi:archaeosine-15-forming tRNA-guanine transglycosylase